MSVNEFASTFSTLIIWCGWNCFEGSEHNAVGCLWVLWKMVLRMWYFSYGHKWSNIYTCTNILSTSTLSCHSTCIYHLAKAWQHFLNTVIAVMVTGSLGYGCFMLQEHCGSFAFLSLCLSVCLSVTHTHTHTHTHSHSRCIVGQGQGVWITSAVKQHFKEWCILYNYTLFMWAIFWGQQRWIMVVRKWLIWQWWVRGFAVFYFFSFSDLFQL
jgi:hypothetical protein